MRKAIVVTWLFASVLCVAGCGADQESASPPPSASSAAATADQTTEETMASAETTATPIQTSGELKVMTAEDMEKLQKERQKQIERPTPLGEENDLLKDVQKKSSSGRG